jgi:hypothetical protein
MQKAIKAIKVYNGLTMDYRGYEGVLRDRAGFFVKIYLKNSKER